MGSLELITIMGKQVQSGTYLLRIRVNQPLQLKFGRFKGGKLIYIPRGAYVYLGSALAAKGSSSLSYRLMRHTKRSINKSCHEIQNHLIAAMNQNNLGKSKLKPPVKKKLFWNIDHLLEDMSVEITNIFIIRSTKRYESIISNMLIEDKHVYVIEQGLGANDFPNETHLLLVNAHVSWWNNLVVQLSRLI